VVFDAPVPRNVDEPGGVDGRLGRGVGRPEGRTVTVDDGGAVLGGPAEIVGDALPADGPPSGGVEEHAASSVIATATIGTTSAGQVGPVRRLPRRR